MSTKTIFSTLTALAVAATLTVGLAACVPAPAAHAPTEAPQPTATAPVIPAAEPGTVVDADTPLPETQRAYGLADGTFIVVDRSKPLPDPVQAKIEADMASSLGRFDPATDDANAVKLLGALDDIRANEGAATGKTIVTVFRTTNTISPIGTGGESYWSLWPMPSGMSGSPDGWTRDHVVSLAERFAAELKNPDSVAIIVAG